MASDSRARMVAGAAQLLGARGVGGTSVRELARFTGAPLGSTYHHFPGGKDQLIGEAVAHVSNRIEGVLARAGDTRDALDAFVTGWRQFLVDSDYGASCPVLAVAAASDTEHDAPAQAAFQRWHTLLVAALERDGVEAGRAQSLAWMIVSAVEGAVVLARSQRSSAPLDSAAAELRVLLEGARPV